MLKIAEIHAASEYQPLRLEKDKDGLYPVPTMRCGVLPYYLNGNQIIWGCVKSDRVGPTTIAPPAGIQDILIVKNDRCFSLEVGKPLPQLDDDFLQEFVGKYFRDDVYQQIIARFIENEFEIYIQNPLVTAIQETYEEHGFDLRNDVGRDHNLLNTLSQLPIQNLSGECGASAQCYWIASLNSTEGIFLTHTKKIENKIRRNVGREFYEQGCWGTLDEFKCALLEERKYSLDSSIPSQKISLIKGVLEAYEENIKLLERIELLIRDDLKKSAFSSNTLSICSEQVFNRGLIAINQNHSELTKGLISSNFVLGFFGLKNRSGDPMELSVERQFRGYSQNSPYSRC